MTAIEDLPDAFVIYYSEQAMLPYEERDCTECFGLKCHQCDNTGTFIRQWGKHLKNHIDATGGEPQVANTAEEQ